MSYKGEYGGKVRFRSTPLRNAFTERLPEPLALPSHFLFYLYTLSGILELVKRIFGGHGGIRTHTVSYVADFKSAAFLPVSPHARFNFYHTGKDSNRLYSLPWVGYHQDRCNPGGAGRI